MSELIGSHGRAVRVPHPIEIESYAIMRTRLDTSDLPPLTRAVVDRIVHTSADPGWAGDLVCDEDALLAGRAALLVGAPLVTDVRMVSVGITAHPSTVALDLAAADLAAADLAAADLAAADLAAADLAQSEQAVGGTRSPVATRSAAGIRAAVRRYPVGAVWAIGNAPTALIELLRCAGTGLVSSPLIIGLPVGFVGSVAAKAALRAAGLPAISNRSERGGAAVAAAAVNALLYAEEPV